MILLVNQHSVPLFVDIANAFASSGQKVTLFTGHIEFGEKPLNSSVRIVYGKSYNRKSSLTRIISWLLFSIHYFFYLIFSKKPSAVLVVSNPPIAPIITSWIARIRNISFNILLYDLYPEALFQAGFTTSTHWVYRLWQKINVKMFASARKVFTLSDSMKKAVSTYMQGSESKIKVIYNWVDSLYIKPMDRSSNVFVMEHNLQDKFVVLYSGNMGLTHDLESFIEAAELLRSSHQIHFILIGEGGKKQKLMEMSKEKGLTNILFLSYQTPENFPYAMAAADIGIVTLGRGAEGISVPSKTYVTMAAGLCLLTIAPMDSELTRLIEHHKIGLSVEPENAAQLSAHIKFLFDNHEILTSYKKTARECSLLYSPDNALLYVAEISNQ